jgi:hypothetical protein
MSAQVPFVPPLPATETAGLAAENSPSTTSARKAKKELIRRLEKDRSQLYRRS